MMVTASWVVKHSWVDNSRREQLVGSCNNREAHVGVLSHESASLALRAPRLANWRHLLSHGRSNSASTYTGQ